MGRRRRAVEQASLRQSITDRVVVGVLVVVAASGLMSLLPAYSQGVVARLACRATSFGLGECGSSSVSDDLTSTQLGPARCPALAGLDAVLPQVEQHRLVTEHGLALEVSQARNGDVWVAVDEPPTAPPEVLAGERRGQRQLLPGVAVPAHTSWWLPRGQGLDELVSGLEQQHRRWVTQRSALALVSSIFAGPDADVPAPTLLASRVQLDRPGLPTVPSSRTGPAQPVEPAALVVDTTVPATLVTNTVTGRTALVATLRGAVQGSAVTGALRVERNTAGSVTSLMIAVVSAGRLTPGETRAPTGPAVAYVSVAVHSPVEQRLVEDWLAAPTGFRLDVEELLGGGEPDPADRRGTFLARAATVTLLRYADGDAGALSRQVRADLTRQWRTESSSGRLQTVGAITPLTSGGARELVEDASCLR